MIHRNLEGTLIYEQTVGTAHRYYQWLIDLVGRLRLDQSTPTAGRTAEDISADI